MDLAKVKSLIEEFVDSKTVNAVLSFAQSDDNSTETINSIAAMFGYSGSFESVNVDNLSVSSQGTKFRLSCDFKEKQGHYFLNLKETL